MNSRRSLCLALKRLSSHLLQNIDRAGSTSIQTKRSRKNKRKFPKLRLKCLLIKTQQLRLVLTKVGSLSYVEAIKSLKKVILLQNQFRKITRKSKFCQKLHNCQASTEVLRLSYLSHYNKQIVFRCNRALSPKNPTRQ